jgi:hypothetical protein
LEKPAVFLVLFKVRRTDLDPIRRSPYRPAASESAAFKGLTEERIRSHVQWVKNFLHNGRPPQKKTAPDHIASTTSKNLACGGIHI